MYVFVSAFVHALAIASRYGSFILQPIECEIVLASDFRQESGPVGNDRRLQLGKYVCIYWQPLKKLFIGML